MTMPASNADEGLEGAHGSQAEQAVAASYTSRRAALEESSPQCQASNTTPPKPTAASLQSSQGSQVTATTSDDGNPTSKHTPASALNATDPAAAPSTTSQPTLATSEGNGNSAAPSSLQQNGTHPSAYGLPADFPCTWAALEKERKDEEALQQRAGEAVRAVLEKNRRDREARDQWYAKKQEEERAKVGDGGGEGSKNEEERGAGEDVK